MTCPPGVQGTKAGWKRHITFPYAEKAVEGRREEFSASRRRSHGDITPRPLRWSEPRGSPRERTAAPNDSNFTDEDTSKSGSHETYSGGPRSARGGSGKNASVSDDGHTGEGNASSLEYRLHEFGVMHPSHDFSYWPGFSLNPALWNLTSLDHSYRETHGRPLRFDSQNMRCGYSPVQSK